MKEIIEKLQTERNCFKTEVEKLKTEKKQLISSNKNLLNKLCVLQKDLAKRDLMYVLLIVNIVSVNLLLQLHI